MALSNALNVALEQPTYTAFMAVQMYTANAIINLVDGCGFVTFSALGNSTTFTSNDPVYGTLSAIAQVSEAVATSAGSTQVTMYPAGTAGFVDINSPLNQGAPCNIWVGAVDPATGLSIGSPELIWQGRYDFAKSTISGQTRSVVIEVVTVLDRLFIQNEGLVLSNAWHQSIWPGETGLSLNIEASADPFWGANIPTPLYPILPIPASTNDQLAGISKGGSTLGNTWGT
jgi:hypothetical protein